MRSWVHNQIKKQKWKTPSTKPSTNYDEGCCLCHMTLTCNIQDYFHYAAKCDEYIYILLNVALAHILHMKFMINLVPSNDKLRFSHLFSFSIHCDLMRNLFTKQPTRIANDWEQHVAVNFDAICFRFNPIKTITIAFLDVVVPFIRTCHTSLTRAHLQ